MEGEPKEKIQLGSESGISPEKAAEIFQHIVGKISIMRHGQTEYTEKYPDLTELGAEQVAGSASKIKEGARPEEDILIASSPAVRAMGSADIVKRELNVEAENRILKSIRPIKAKDLVEFKKTFAEFWGPGGPRMEEFVKWDRFYATDPRFENRPEVQEPRSSAEKRSLRGLDKAIGFMSKYRAKYPDRIPHLVAVSHLEFFNHIGRKVFGLDKEDAEQVRFAELMEFTLLRNEADTRSKKIPVLITFRGETKKIIFDREKRSIESINERR